MIWTLFSTFRKTGSWAHKLFVKWISSYPHHMQLCVGCIITLCMMHQFTFGLYLPVIIVATKCDGHHYQCVGNISQHSCSPTCRPAGIKVYNSITLITWDCLKGPNIWNIWQVYSAECVSKMQSIILTILGYADLCARSMYQEQKQIILSHRYCGMQLLVPALDTCFWHPNPDIWTSKFSDDPFLF